jgi:hypothetical protein
MHPLHIIELDTDSFFAGMLFPFAEEGQVYLMTVVNKDKYNLGQTQIKLPGGTGDRPYANWEKYQKRLEEVLAELSYDRIATLKVLNREYDRREAYAEHPQKKRAHWLLHTLTLSCLEGTGYYPADTEPWVVDVVEKSEDHYQYFFEIKELWDANANPVKIPQADEAFKPLDKDVVATRQKMDIYDFEEELIGSHQRPVEFYLEYLKRKAQAAREQED